MELSGIYNIAFNTGKDCTVQTYLSKLLWSLAYYKYVAEYKFMNTKNTLCQCAVINIKLSIGAYNIAMDECNYIGRFTLVHWKKILGPKLQEWGYTSWQLPLLLVKKTPTSRHLWSFRSPTVVVERNVRYFQTPLVVVRWHLLVQPPKLEVWDTSEGS